MKTISLTIERDGSYFPVEVLPGNLAVGYFEHPEFASGDRRYDLTSAEQDEARALSESQDDEPDDFPAVFATGREADDAANAWMGERFNEMTRRGE